MESSEWEYEIINEYRLMPFTDIVVGGLVMEGIFTYHHVCCANYHLCTFEVCRFIG